MVLTIDFFIVVATEFKFGFYRIISFTMTNLTNNRKKLNNHCATNVSLARNLLWNNCYDSQYWISHKNIIDFHRGPALVVNTEIKRFVYNEIGYLGATRLTCVT